MKKIISAVLTLVLVLVLPIGAFAVTNKYFSDVPIGLWCYDAVRYSVENKAMIGITDTEFKPDGVLTRAMVVTVLSRISGAVTDAYTESGFDDVDITRYYGKPVAWAKANGIVKGMTLTQFCPEDTVTREQMCVMLSNFFDYLHLTVRNTEKPAFDDESEISRWAYAAVIRLQRAEIVKGKGDNRFEPKIGTTRAELAQIILNSYLCDISH